jgi:hypothetical protein
MSNRLRVALCFALFAAPTLQAQGPPPPDKFLYGTYNIQTKGDSGPVTMSSSGGSREIREESETSSWQLTFYKNGTANSVKTHLVSWTHELVTTQIIANARIARIVTSVKTERLWDRPDVTGSLTLHWGNGYRQLLMSDSDVTADVKTTTTITNYASNGAVIGTPDVRPAPGQKFSPDELIMHLDLAWESAQWNTNYSGSLTVQNNYQDYIAPKSNYHWLTVKAQWNLNP